jgi:hypothetical protein
MTSKGDQKRSNKVTTPALPSTSSTSTRQRPHPHVTAAVASTSSTRRAVHTPPTTISNRRNNSSTTNRDNAVPRKANSGRGNGSGGREGGNEGATVSASSASSSLVDEFCNITAMDPSMAMSYLEAHEWNVELAVQSYMVRVG